MRRRWKLDQVAAAIAAALITLVVTITIGPGGNVKVEIRDAHQTPAEAQLDVTPKVDAFDADHPGGLPPAATGEIPGKTPAQEDRIEQANDATIDAQTYDTTGVLDGAAGQGAKYKCYTPMNGGPRSLKDIGLGVVHVTVSLNVRGRGDGDGLCGFFRRVKASPTWTVDNEGLSWENVPLGRIPWTQVFYNRTACAIENVGSTGRPGQGPAQWTDAQLREGARLMAGCFAQAGIPIRVGAVTPGGRIIRTGVIFHQELGVLGGGHTDPGPYFNRTLFLTYMRQWTAGARRPTARARGLCQELNGLRRGGYKSSELPRARAIRKALEPKYVCRYGPPGSIRRR